MAVYRKLWLSAVYLVGGLCSLVALLGDRVWVTVAVALSMAVVSAYATDLYREGAFSAIGCRHPLIAGGIAFLATFVLAGLITMVGLGMGLMVVGLFGVVSPPVLRSRITLTLRLTAHRPSVRRRLLLPQEFRSKAGGNDAARDPRVTGVTARSLSDVELCLAWCLSSTALELYSPDVGDRHELVAARQEYLDELERRDPEGFQRWLSAGARPSSDPSGYLGAVGDGPASEGDQSAP